MDIAFLRQKSGRDLACRSGARDVRISLCPPVPILDMTLDVKSSQIVKIAGDRAKSSVVLTGVRLDNAAPEHRLIRPRCGFSNTER